MALEQDLYDNYWSQEWLSSFADAILPSEQEIFQEFIHKGDLVVDYGCGPADRYSGFIERLGAAYRGFDISKVAAEEGRNNGKDVRLLTSDGQTSCQNHEADAAVCLEVLEHLLKPSVAVSELARIVKPGGLVILSVPNAGVWMARLEFLLTGFLCPNGIPKACRSEPWDDPHIRFFTKNTLSRLVETSGFEVIKCSSANPFTLAALPYCYRIPWIAKILNVVSRPFGWLSAARPSLFATRLLLVGRRRDDS